MTVQNISLWNSDNSLEITAINYGIGNAGSILPLADDFATTDVNVGTDTITLDIDLATGTGIKFTTTVADLPDPLVVGTLYFAIRVDATHIQVATTYANAVAGTEITITDQGTGTHTVTMDNEYHIWNDKGNVLTSSPMTSVLVTVRDSDGRLVENITTQGWVEAKSLTIHAGDDGGAVGDYVDDNMADFQPVGKDNFVPIGSIPYDCYRKVQFRLRIPTSALTDGVSFKIYVTCQQPQVAIADWFTGIHGDGVVYLAAGAFGVSINGGDASLLDVEKGFSLISTSSVYYGNEQQYDVSGLDNGTYKVYLTQVGVISSILEAEDLPANTIELTRAVVDTAECTSVTDKRNFIASVMAGLDAAKTATPTINQLYIATDTTKVYACFTDDSWTVIYDPDTVTKTGTFTAGRMVKINNASGILEMATNTDTEVADAVTKAHSQNTDTGTDQTTFQIDSGNSGPKVKNNAGTMEARNAADDAYADFKALVLYGDGSNITDIGAAAANALTMTARAGENLKKGQAVYVSGSVGAALPIVSLCDCDDADKIRMIGVAAENIDSGNNGLIRIRGLLIGVDTLGVSDVNPDGETWAARQLLYVRPDGSGGYTKTRPTSGRTIQAAYSLVGSSNTDDLLIFPHVNPIHLEAASGEDICLRMGDSVGANKVEFKNNLDVVVAIMNSYGQMEVTDLESTNDITINGSALASIYQPLDTALTNISALVYVSPSFLKLTGDDTYEVRTLAETKTDLSLDNVTNDAQLKRAAGDINTFDAKAAPVSADLALVEDSEDSNNKKKIQLGNIPIDGGSF